MSIIDKFLSVVKPADICNTAGHTSIFNLPTYIAYWAIRKAQHSLFTNAIQYYNNPEHYLVKLDPANDTHTTVFFDAQHTFSVEPPKAKFLNVEEYINDDISVYRYYRDLSGSDVNVMRNTAVTMIGFDYDVGQLIDISINQILGYPGHNEVTIFDNGKNNHDCSAGAGIIYQAMRKANHPDWPRLFSYLSPNYWSPQFIKKFKTEYKSDWYVEFVYPCMFACSETHFASEFRLVWKSNKGKILYCETQ